MIVWHLVLYGAVVLVMAILSGIAGGGGGFVTTPLLILLGLSPAQAVATGKLGGVMISLGSLHGLKSVTARLSRWHIIPVMILALVIGLIAPRVILNLDPTIYKLSIAIILLLMVPLLKFKKIGLESRKHQRRQSHIYIGYGFLTIALFLQGIFSSGLGTLVNIALMGALGFDAREASAVKRWSQMVLNVVIVLGVIGSGLIAWRFVAVGVPAAYIGGFVGGKIAVKKGNGFVVNTLIVLIIASALALVGTL